MRLILLLEIALFSDRLALGNLGGNFLSEILFTDFLISLAGAQILQPFGDGIHVLGNEISNAGNGSDGGNGRIEWWQAGDTYQVMLRAPVTRQGWSLTADAGGARIEGLDGGPLVGPDPSGLLLEATGMDVPVDALAAWAAGTRADPAAHGPARLEFTAEGRLVRIRQGGWTIDYVNWQPEADGQAAEPLPRRVDAARGQARVRLVVDEWTLGAPAPGGA